MLPRSSRHTFEGDAAFSEVPGGRPLSFSRLIRGETAGRQRRQCGGGKNPPQVSRRKDQAGSLGTEEKAESSLALIKLSNSKQPYGVNWSWATSCTLLTKTHLIYKGKITFPNRRINHGTSSEVLIPGWEASKKA